MRFMEEEGCKRPHSHEYLPPSLYLPSTFWTLRQAGRLSPISNPFTFRHKTLDPQLALSKLCEANVEKAVGKKTLSDQRIENPPPAEPKP